MASQAAPVRDAAGRSQSEMGNRCQSVSQPKRLRDSEVMCRRPMLVSISGASGHDTRHQRESPVHRSPGDLLL